MKTTDPRTSVTHPLQIAEIRPAPDMGKVGLTLCPGKSQSWGLTGAWARDLALDLDVIADWDAAVVLTLVEEGELERLQVPGLGEAVGNRHMEWLHMPIRDRGAPDAVFEEAWVEVGERLRDATSIAFTYDNLNRVTTKNLPSIEPDVTYAWDNLSRLTSASQTGNALSFGYDALSRMTSQSGPQGTMSAQFDAAGRRTLLTYADAGLSVNYDWLVTGEIRKIRENGAVSGVGVLATYAYDQLGNMTSKTFGNNVVQAFTFDAVSRLQSLTSNLSGGINDLTATFTMTAGSQIKSTARTGDSYPYTAFTDVSRNYVSNGLNQYTSSSNGAVTTTYGYDSKGNLTSDGTNAFAYTSENLLKTGPNASSLTYDPLTRLYQLTSGAATTRWGYDGVNMVAEYDGANALLRRHVFAPGLDRPIVTYEGATVSSTTRRFLSADERGSIIAVSDSNGAKLSTNGYDEYGIPQSPASATAGTTGQGSVFGRFGYTGQAWLPEVGLYYYKARVYSPTLGRFMQTDPIGYADGANWYAYVGNDPVNFIDPSGTSFLRFGFWGAMAGAAISAAGQTLEGRDAGMTWAQALNAVDGRTVAFDALVGGAQLTLLDKVTLPLSNPVSQQYLIQGVVGQKILMNLDAGMLGFRPSPDPVKTAFLASKYSPELYSIAVDAIMDYWEATLAEANDAADKAADFIITVTIVDNGDGTVTICTLGHCEIVSAD